MPIEPPRRHFVASAAALVLTAMVWPRARAARPLQADERVLFLPSTARWCDDGQIEAELHAWVYAPSHLHGLNTTFARYLGLRQSKMAPAERQRFRERAALFHSDSEGDRQIGIVFGDQAAMHLPPTDAAGRTQARVRLEPPPTTAAGAPWLRFHAEIPQGSWQNTPGSGTRNLGADAGASRGSAPARPWETGEGRVLLVPDEGLSVISDIDDTIKHTDVRHLREMLLNTFVRPFRATPGMAAHYQRLARVADTRFHYLSASPIQLLPALMGFFEEAGFPPGSLHLRESTRWHTVVPGSQDSRRHKRAIIEQLLADFPRRRFLLVGDSGEADPEIYGQTVRDHPTRIDAVVIRDVTGEGRDAARYRAAFDGVTPTHWHLLPRDSAPWPMPLPYNNALPDVLQSAPSSRPLSTHKAKRAPF